MKVFLGLSYLLLVSIVSCHPAEQDSGRWCVNVWDEGCNNGQLPGSGGDDDYLNGGFNPGKRCVNPWDAGCSTGPLSAAGGNDDSYKGNKHPVHPTRQELLAKLFRDYQFHN
ncbi:unnamed protein product [Leptidea sinapis]|uniref:Uncharacterized protein n=1 Tax=Leptidea sinapis TaxID=189913 RepID=A0A5E4QH73_9NEOP|nr:unnamed protein product [Leptidea sinapis]